MSEYRRTTIPENLRMIVARLSDHLSPAEKGELEEAALTVETGFYAWGDDQPFPTGFVVMPEMVVLQAIRDLNEDGDEHGVAARLSNALKEAPDAAPQEPVVEAHNLTSGGRSTAKAAPAKAAPCTACVAPSVCEAHERCCFRPR